MPHEVIRSALRKKKGQSRNGTAPPPRFAINPVVVIADKRFRKYVLYAMAGDGGKSREITGWLCYFFVAFNSGSRYKRKRDEPTRERWTRP